MIDGRRQRYARQRIVGPAARQSFRKRVRVARDESLVYEALPSAGVHAQPVACVFEDVERRSGG